MNEKNNAAEKIVLESIEKNTQINDRFGFLKDAAKIGDEEQKSLKSVIAERKISYTNLNLLKNKGVISKEEFVKNGFNVLLDNIQMALYATKTKNLELAFKLFKSNGNVFNDITKYYLNSAVFGVDENLKEANFDLLYEKLNILYKRIYSLCDANEEMMDYFNDNRLNVEYAAILDNRASKSKNI